MVKLGVLGIGITRAENLQGKPTVYVEYHRCDDCGKEFRLYYRSERDLEDVKEELRAKLEKNGGRDICFLCQDPLPSEQLLLPLRS